MNAASFQFRFKNGKTFVTDPFYPTMDDPKWGGSNGKGSEIRANALGGLFNSDFMSTGAQIFIPMHHEEDYENEDKNAWAAEFNEYLAQQGYNGRCFMPERARWHTINFGVTAV